MPLFPRLAAWRSASPWRADRLPDAVTDSTARRQVGAGRRLAAWRRVRREAIRRGGGPGLVLVTVPLPGRLYGADAHAHARQAVAALVGPWPAWYGLESGQRVGLHAHIVAPVDAVPHVLAACPEAHGVPVWSLRGLAGYLSKPRDARAASAAHARQPSPLAALAAAEGYLSARAAHWAATGSRRLPAASGVLGVPRASRRPAPPSPGLFLAALAAVLAADLARRQAHADRQARALASARLARSLAAQARADRLPASRPAPRRPGRSWAFLASRRPAPVGHARPPPIGEPRPGQRLPVGAAPP